VSDGGRRIVIEGWRLFPHSYAIVNQWQILALLRKGHAVDFHDLPYQDLKSPTVHGFLAPQDEQKVTLLTKVDANHSYDLCYRISYPFNFGNRALGGAKAKRLVVFGTAEHQFLSADLAVKPDIDLLNSDETFFVVTPSAWSAKGFLRLGLSPSRVKVIPHGVDPATFNGNRSQREGVRNQLGLRGFAFLHCGAMTRNKGVDLLIRAFRILIDKHHDVQLVLKGTDRLYGSNELVFSYLNSLDYYGQRAVAEKLVYVGNVVSMSAMADLYRAADCYVSPYRAEGFNLPVLEAAACGTPVICTNGGPTDEFVSGTFCRKISSAFNEAANGSWLEPDLDHLVVLMEEALQDDNLRRTALVEGPSFVSREHTWDDIVDRLISVAGG